MTQVPPPRGGRRPGGADRAREPEAPRAGSGGGAGGLRRRALLGLGAGLGVAGVGLGGTALARTPAGGVPAAAWKALSGGLEGTLVRPGEQDYDTARLLFNSRFDGVRPAGVAYCATPEDVRECLGFARRHGVSVAVRSGGHSYAGWPSGNGRLVVDVQRMNGVSLTGTRGGSGGTATVGAGAKLVDVYDRLAARGRTVPGGSCPSVGVSGLALGGGVGVVSRAYGLTSDNLVGARIVTADGTVRDVRAGREADLFWALRGGGGAGLGVVTSLRLRTRPAPRCVSFFAGWPWSRAAAVLREWQRWAPYLPDEIWSNLHLSAPVGKRPGNVVVGGLSLGTQDDLENRLDRLADLIGAPAATLAVRERPYMDAMMLMGGVSGRTVEQAHLPGTLPGRTPQGRLGREAYAARSDFYTRRIPDDGVRALLARVEALAEVSGGGAGSVAFDALGGAVNRVAPADTAFVHRNALFLAQYLASWPADAGAATVAGHRRWLDGTHAAMRPWASGAAYQNYTDPALKDWRRAYYGENAARLARVRAAHDPDRLFRTPQSL